MATNHTPTLTRVNSQDPLQRAQTMVGPILRQGTVSLMVHLRGLAVNSARRQPGSAHPHHFWPSSNRARHERGRPPTERV